MSEANQASQVLEKCEYEVIRDQRIKELKEAFHASGLLEEVKSIRESLLERTKVKSNIVNQTI